MRGESVIGEDGDDSGDESGGESGDVSGDVSVFSSACVVSADLVYDKGRG